LAFVGDALALMLKGHAFMPIRLGVVDPAAQVKRLRSSAENRKVAHPKSQNRETLFAIFTEIADARRRGHPARVSPTMRRAWRLLMLPMLSGALVWTVGRTSAAPCSVCCSRFPERHHQRGSLEAVVMASRLRVRERVQGWVSKCLARPAQAVLNQRVANGAMPQEEQQPSAGDSATEQVDGSPVAQTSDVSVGGQEISASAPEMPTDELRCDGEAALDSLPLAEDAPVGLPLRVDSVSMDERSFGARVCANAPHRTSTP